MAMVWMVADARCASTTGSAVCGNSPLSRARRKPTVKAYYERLHARPSIARAVAEEFELYKAELVRHKAAA
jgi:hypothetical protein